LPFGVVVQDGCQIGRNGSQVEFAIDQFRRDFIRRTVDGKDIRVLCFALISLIHQVNQTDPGGSFQTGNTDLVDFGPYLV